jgi:hypothetical protein
MEKEFIPYQQALVLKQLGFNEPCFAFYTPEKQLIIARGDVLQSVIENAPTSPLYQQAFSFFRDKYNLDVTFRKMDYGPESQFTGYYFSIYKGNELIDIHGADKKGKLFEDSELECLKKLIEIVKNDR